MMIFRLGSVGTMCAVLGLTSLAQAQDPDPWLGTDKGKHFSASAVFAAGGYAAAMLLVEEPWQRAAIGGGFAFTLGIGKEVYDATGHGDPSWRDLTWDLIGCAMGVGTSLLIEYAFRAPAHDAEGQGLQPPTAAAW